MDTLVLKNIVWQEGKYFVAQCLNVEVSSFGETRDQALANLQEALELYFEGEDIAEFTEIKNPEIVNSFLKRA